MIEETSQERDKRIAWMEQHLGVPFCEMRQRSQAALADTLRNRQEMQPSPKGALNFQHIDEMTARIQARRDKGK